MFALPDHSAEFQAFARRTPLRELVAENKLDWSFAAKAIMLCGATALFAAAAGLWAFPASDDAVRLIKLGASLGFAGAGLVLLLAVLGRRDFQRVEIDPKRQEIRSYERDAGGRVYLTGRFHFRDMSEISLRNGTFTANAFDGRYSVTAPVRSRRQARAIRSALARG